MPTINAPLMRQIAEVIDSSNQYDERYDQSAWGSDADGNQIHHLTCRSVPLEEATSPECGWTACIAGWAVLLTPVEKRPTPAELLAERRSNEGEDERLDIAISGQLLLGLTYDEASRLFASELEDENAHGSAAKLLRTIADRGHVSDADFTDDDTDDDDDWDDDDNSELDDDAP